MSENAVQVDIRANTASFKKGTEEAKRQLEELRGETNQNARAATEASGAIGTLVRSAGALGLTAGAVATAIGGWAAAKVALAKASIDTADELDKMSEKTGIAASELSALSLAAKVGDTDIKQVGAGMKNLARSMFEANSGNESLRATFRALGVEFADANGKLRPVLEVMLDVADRFERMEAGAGKTAVAMKLFKGSGEELMPFLNQGREGIAALRTEAQKLGLVMSDETARAAGEFNKNVKVLTESATALSRSLAADMLPSLKEITDQMRLARTEGGFLAMVWAGIKTAAAEAMFAGPQGDLQKMLGDRTRALGEIGVHQRRLEEIRAGTGAPSSAQEMRYLQRQIDRRNAMVTALQPRIEEQQRLVDLLKPGGITGEPPAKVAPPDLRDKPETGGGARGEKVLTYEELIAKGQKNAMNYQARREQEAEARGEREYAAEQRDAEKRAQDAKREEEQIRRTREAYVDLYDPIEKVRRRLVQLDKDEAAGIVTAEQAINARFALNQEMDKLAFGGSIEKVTDQFKDLRDSIEGWGRDVSRELGRASIEGKLSLDTLGNSVKNLAIELASIQINKRLMQPLIKAGTGFLDNLFGTEKLANGGVMTAAGPMPLRRYSAGGVADRPQLALFGEGSSPEAFVPLPDGRRIPVAMQGGGLESVRVEIENRGGEKVVSGAVPMFDPQGLVIRVMLDDVRSNGPFAQAMQNTFGARRASFA